MRKVSEDYMSRATASGRKYYLYVDIEKERTTETGEKVTETERCGFDKIDTLKIVYGQTTGVFTVRQSYSSTLTATFSNSVVFFEKQAGDTDATNYITVYVGFGDNPETDAEKRILGKFEVDTINKNEKSQSITAYDVIITLNTDFITDELTIPMQSSELAPYILGDIKSNITTLYDPQVLVEPIAGTTEDGDKVYYTKREMLQFLAGINGGSAYYDPEDGIQFTAPRETEYTIGANSVISATAETTNFKIYSITPMNIAGDVYSDEYGSITVPIPFIKKSFSTAEDGGANLARVFHNFTYDAVKLQKQGTAVFQLGDIVYFEDLNKNLFKLYVTGIVYDFSGGFFTETLYSLAQTPSQRKYSKPTASYSSVSSGGGVGKASSFDKTSEYFNDYGHNIAGVENSACYAHAEGLQTQAIAPYAHSEGSFTKATGIWAHSEGFQTVASGASAHVEGYYSEATGGSSHAEGYSTKATGESSHAGGQSSTAEGIYSFAHGISVNARGSASVALGSGTSVQGTGSFGCGSSVTIEGGDASAVGAAAFGVSNKIKSSGGSFATGRNNTVDGGLNNTAEGDRNTLTGSSTTHIGGNDNTANNCVGTLVFGNSNKCEQTQNSAVIGMQNAPNNAQFTTVTGMFNKATGTQGCLVGGMNADLQREYFSAACGNGIKLQDGQGRAAFGSYNEDGEDIIFAVGGGTSDTDRKNLFWGDKDGNFHVLNALYINGEQFSGGGSGGGGGEGGVTQEYVDTQDEKTLTAAKEYTDALAERVGALETAITEFQGLAEQVESLKMLVEDLQDLPDKMSALQSTITDLQTENEQMRGEITSLESRVSALEQGGGSGEREVLTNGTREIQQVIEDTICEFLEVK